MNLSSLDASLFSSRPVLRRGKLVQLCFTDKISFLSPSQQCQSTQENLKNCTMTRNITHQPYSFLIHRVLEEKMTFMPGQNFNVTTRKSTHNGMQTRCTAVMVHCNSHQICYFTLLHLLKPMSCAMWQFYPFLLYLVPAKNIKCNHLKKPAP